MEILFDSKKTEHKTPFGCIREGETCTLFLHIPDCCGATGASLTVENDEGFFLSVSLLPRERNAPYTVYKTAFTLPAAGLYFYHFKIKTDGGGFSLYKKGDGTNMEEGERWQISCLPKDFHTPKDFRGALYYQIFPDRFYKSEVVGICEKKTDFVLHKSEDDVPLFLPDERGIIRNRDFFGGNLRGITEKLPYLASLSVSVIYLNPIFEAYSNHRYDTADYLRIDPLLGTEEDFKALCDAAHALGIRVVLDGVFSHTGADSRYFDKEGHYGGGAYHDPASPYRAWYQFEEYPHKYASWWGIDTLPATNELCPSYLDFIIRDEESVIAHWLRAGADGFRLDVADELPDAFIALLRKRVKEIKPDAIVIGEVWEDASNKISYSVRRKYFTGAELDSVMNYPFRDAIIGFLQGHISAFDLADTVMRICENYPSDVVSCLMNSLSTHDTPRILTLLADVPAPKTREERAAFVLDTAARKRAKEKLFCALFLQFTLPGSPCIYYGDEAGLEGCEDPFNRRFFPWGKEDEEILAFTKALVSFRRDSEILRLGDTHAKAVSENVVKITRSKDERTLVCLLAREEEHPLPEGKILFAHKAKDGRLLPLGCAIVEI